MNRHKYNRCSLTSQGERKKRGKENVKPRLEKNQLAAWEGDEKGSELVCDFLDHQIIYSENLLLKE